MTFSHLSVAFLPSAALPFARPTTFRNAVRTLSPHNHPRLSPIRTPSPSHLNAHPDSRPQPPSALALDFSRSEPAPPDFDPELSPARLPDPSLGFVPSDDDPDTDPDDLTISESEADEDEDESDIDTFISDIPSAGQRVTPLADADPIDEVLDDSEPDEEDLALVDPEDPSNSLMVDADDADADVLVSHDDDDGDNGINPDDFEQAETDEDIQSAADILSNRGLLGLGVERRPRRDASSLRRFALMDNDDDEDEDEDANGLTDQITAQITEGLEDEGDNDEGDARAAAIAAAMDEYYKDGSKVKEQGNADRGADQPNLKVKDNDGDNDGDEKENEEEDETDIAITDESYENDDYPDMEETEGNSDIGLTSPGSVGRVWDLNEDTYITITEPGEAYGYELDEDDEEDQDMASMRRGKQGGWSGGLASYPSTDLPEGSKEWIARRSYELMLKVDADAMYRWAKRHLEPPPEIAALYSKHIPATSPISKSAFSMSTPPSANEMMAVENEEAEDDITLDEDDDGMEALKRAIKFPCTYRFKVEGDESEEFLPSVRETAEEVLNRKLADSAFTVEQEGRYERVTIMVEVKNARQVTELYDALRNNPGVKFSYG